jgi:hypothetical protein
LSYFAILTLEEGRGDGALVRGTQASVFPDDVPASQCWRQLRERLLDSSPDLTLQATTAFFWRGPE